MAHPPQNIPQIITTDLSSKPNIISEDEDNVAYLSPRSTQPQPPSPLSPTPTLNVPSVPPSPTFSDISVPSAVRFSTALDLRSNRPDEPTAGQNSLSLLYPVDRAHSRNNSWASSTASTEPDHLPRQSTDLRHVKSTSTERTHVDVQKRSTSDSEKTAVPDTGQGSSSRKSSKGTVDAELKNGEDSNQPRSRTDLAQDADTDPTPFRFGPYELAAMLDPKNLESLESFGGAIGLLKGLGVTQRRGLSSKPVSVNTPRPPGEPPRKGKETAPEMSSPREEASQGYPPNWNLDAFSATLADRTRVYGPNDLPDRPSKSLLQLMWAALKDKVLVLLSVAAVVSLALGLFQDFGTPRPAGEPPVDWVEGVAIMVAVFIVVVVGSVNDWQKERQFKVLNDKKEERGLKVIRDGKEHIIDVKSVVVGDIALLEPGEIVPCDGVFLSGHNVRCDESSATGESDAIRKIPYSECIALRERERASGGGGEKGLDAHSPNSHSDCFIISGSKVLEGVGQYVVVAVGTKSFNGRIMMALLGDSENTPLQLKLNALAELIAKLGSAAGLILFTALMIRFFVQLGKKQPVRTASQNGIAFVNILIISVTLVVVAVPEGLPLAVTLALAFATKRMTREKLLVRVLGSCETMANASVICTDKTGTLTQNFMTVVAGSVGLHAKFVRKLEENSERSNALETEYHSSTRKHPKDFALDQTNLGNVMSRALRELFNSAIAINSTAFEDVDPETGETVFVGNKTETALLKFAKELGWEDYRGVRDSAEVVQMVPFSSERKAMGVVVKLGPNKWRLHLKGASEILTKRCVRHVVVYEKGAQALETGSDEVETKEIDELARDNISRTIIFYANQTLRTIALCYRDFDFWPPKGSSATSADDVPYEDFSSDLTLIGITGIEDPLRENVRDAVAKCHKAGVLVKMCTGDNVLTARSIALQCGIYTPGGIIMEGPVFRDLSPPEMDEIVPRLQVLARSSPEDKKILVERLKRLGEIVGVTGDGTNDGPALKTANVGFSMGIAGTEVAKEASDIILMDDNFSSIVKAIMWGRCVNDAVRKFLQFQVSTNVTAVVVTFVSAVASDQEASVLSAVQLLWVNIIMDTFAALALATDPASESLLDRQPDKKTAPLFTVNMYKQILFQSTYQIVVTLIFHFLGNRILGLAHDKHNDAVIQTLVFNAFVFAQIFNSVNCRRLDRKLNIFEGVSRNWYFIVITAIEIAVQILIVFVGGSAFQVTRIGGREWGIALALGVVSMPLGVLVRLLPNEPFEKLFIKTCLLPNPEVLPVTRDDQEWNSAINKVRDGLGIFGQVRGGRVRSSSFVVKSRSAKLNNEGERVQLPSLMAMVPALVASSIGARWTPQNGSLSDPTHFDPSKSSAALWEGKIQLHPDTPANDPAFRRWGLSPDTEQAQQQQQQAQS